MQWLADMVPRIRLDGLVVVLYWLDMSQRYTESDKLVEANKVVALVPTMSMRKACKKSGVSMTSFHRWIVDNAELRKQYVHARSLYHEQLADEILTISEEKIGTDWQGKTDNGKVQQNRLRIDSRKWLLSKLAPKKYGDRLTVAGDDDNPIVIAAVERKIIQPKTEEIEE